MSENIKVWKRQVEIYLLASGSSSLPNNVQTATIINCGGENLLNVYVQFTWEGKHKDNPADVLSKIEEYCNPGKNEVSESHKFWSIKYFEPFDSFLTELRTKASSCNFGPAENPMLRDKIVFSASGKIQQLLLLDDDLDIQKAIKICQHYINIHRYNLRTVTPFQRVAHPEKKVYQIILNNLWGNKEY